MPEGELQEEGGGGGEEANDRGTVRGEGGGDEYSDGENVMMMVVIMLMKIVIQEAYAIPPTSKETLNGLRAKRRSRTTKAVRCGTSHDQPPRGP